MEGNSELMLVVAVAGGLIAGFFIGWLSRPSGGDKEEELKRCQEELERYRNEVGGHFAKTAELVGQMTAQYRAVYEHLAEGAHRLGGEQANRLEAAIIQGESLLAGPAEADEEKAEPAASQGDSEAAGEEAPSAEAQDTTSAEDVEHGADKEATEGAPEEAASTNGQETVDEAKKAP